MALVFCTRCGHRVSTTAPKCPSCGTPPYRSRVASTASTDPPTNDATAPLTTPESAAPRRGLRIAGQLIGWTLAIVVIGGLYNVLHNTSTARTAPSPPASEASPPAAETTPVLPSILPPKFEVTSLDPFGKDKGLKIVLTDQQPVAVQRVVINGRAGEEGCDFTREALVKACLDEAQKATAPGREAVPDDFEAEYNGHKGQADEGLVERSEEFCRHHNDRAATDDEFTACWDEWLEHHDFAPGTPLIPADLKRLAEESVREGTAEYAEDKAACSNGGVFKGEGSDDQRVEPWPQTLKTGDSLHIATDCGEQIVNIKIITDRGEATYDTH